MIKTFIAEFVNHLRIEKRMSEHTCIAYENDLISFTDYLDIHYPDISIQNIALIHIRSWIAYLASEGNKPTSLKRRSSALNSFFKYLLIQGIVKVNPAKLLLTPKAPKPLPYFLEQQQTNELSKVLNTTDFEDIESFTQYLIIEILYQTGIRRAELISIKEKDIDIHGKQIKVLGKRNKERIVPISQALVMDIENYLSLKKKCFGFPTENLLTLKSGKKLYDNYVYRTVKQQLTSNEITTIKKKSPHIMRHTFATQLSANGAEINSIKELLGHSSLASTQVYTHTNIERLKEVYRKSHPKS